MNPAFIGLIGAVVGAIIGAGTAILNSYLSSRYQLKLENEKGLIARRDALSKELRGYVAEVAREMLSAQHSMEWVCWSAKKGRHLVNEELVTQYHKEIHGTFPKLLGALANVSSLDVDAYKALAALADQLYKVDAKIADALAQYKVAPEQTAELIAQYYPDAFTLYQSLPLGFTKIMKYVNEGGEENILSISSPRRA